MENMKIIIPKDGANEIPKGYKPLFTEDGKFVAIIPEGANKSDFYWLKIDNVTPIIDWEQRRYDLAKTAMIELMNFEYYRDDRKDPNQRNSGLITNRVPLCSCAIGYADEMVTQLKKCQSCEE